MNRTAEQENETFSSSKLAFSLSPYLFLSIHKYHIQTLKLFTMLLQVRISYPKANFSHTKGIDLYVLSFRSGFLSFWEEYSTVKKQCTSQWLHTWIVSRPIPLSDWSRNTAKLRPCKSLNHCIRARGWKAL